MVQIVNSNTLEIKWQSEPASERQAEKIEKGANINLNHKDYFTRILEVEEV